jgi:putative hydrolase of the HAD superfamily
MVDVLDRSFRARACGMFGSAEATLRWVGEQAGGRPDQADLRAAFAARVDALRSDTRLRPDAVSTLSALKQRGIATGLVSDCTHELPAFLPGLPIAPLLDTTVFSVETGRCKPDPLIYLTACRELDVLPEDCLYVGDGGSRELTGATDVGMTAVRLAARDLAGHLVFDPDVRFSGPTVGTLAEVLELVDHTVIGSLPEAFGVPVLV